MFSFFPIKNFLLEEVKYYLYFTLIAQRWPLLGMSTFFKRVATTSAVPDLRGSK